MHWYFPTPTYLLCQSGQPKKCSHMLSKHTIPVLSPSWKGEREGRREEKTDWVRNKQKAITVSHLLSASSKVQVFLKGYFFHQAFPSSLTARALCLSESPLGLHVHSSPPVQPCIWRVHTCSHPAAHLSHQYLSSISCASTSATVLITRLAHLTSHTLLSGRAPASDLYLHFPEFFVYLLLTAKYLAGWKFLNTNKTFDPCPRSSFKSSEKNFLKINNTFLSFVVFIWLSEKITQRATTFSES